MNNLKERTISLVVTERCNLNCIYCYEHHKTTEEMTFSTAKKIIDKELRNANKEKVYLDFFGGEPFLNFSLIQEVYEYVKSFNKKPIRFFATTNGTLIHDDLQRWLIERRKDFTVGLSLDGTRHAHNINRSNSYDDIDLDFFLKYYPQQGVKMTVSAASLPFLAESVIDLSEKGFEVNCNLAYMVDWLSPEYAPLLERELETLITYYVAHPHIHRCTMLDFNIGIISRPVRNPHIVKKFCGTGTSMKCYDTKGECYPCQLFIPLSAEERAVKYEDAPFKEEFSIEYYKPKCRTCMYLPLCPICLGSNYISTGDFYTVDDARCNLYQNIFRANAKLKALLWNQGALTFHNDEEQALLRAISQILN